MIFLLVVCPLFAFNIHITKYPHYISASWSRVWTLLACNVLYRTYPTNMFHLYCNTPINWLVECTFFEGERSPDRVRCAFPPTTGCRCVVHRNIPLGKIWMLWFSHDPKPVLKLSHAKRMPSVNKWGSDFLRVKSKLNHMFEPLISPGPDFDLNIPALSPL